MDPVALQRFFNFLVSRARAAVIELQDVSGMGGWMTHINEMVHPLLEEMVRIMFVILLCYVIYRHRNQLPFALVLGNALAVLYIRPFTRACHSSAPVDAMN